MTNKNENINVPATISDENKSEFKGYSLEDLRYRRALVALQKEFAKSKILSASHKLQSFSPFSRNFGEGKSNVGKVGAIAQKLISGLNYLDYAMIGYNVFTSGKKILNIFRKKRK